jgi:hypothetical protein
MRWKRWSDRGFAEGAGRWLEIASAAGRESHRRRIREEKSSRSPSLFQAIGSAPELARPDVDARNLASGVTKVKQNVEVQHESAITSLR